MKYERNQRKTLNRETQSIKTQDKRWNMREINRETLLVSVNPTKANTITNLQLPTPSHTPSQHARETYNQSTHKIMEEILPASNNTARATQSINQNIWKQMKYVGNQSSKIASDYKYMANQYNHTSPHSQRIAHRAITQEKHHHQSKHK